MILSRGGEWIWRQHRGKNPVAMSGSSDLKWLGLMQGTSCQVGVSFKSVEEEACGGRCCQDVQQVQRLRENMDGCHVGLIF